MFHTYVKAASGTVVDFDRASFLMDKDLLRQAIEMMEARHDKRPDETTEDRAQCVWSYYCDLHLEKYDRDFEPDAIPGWDNPPRPEPKPVDLGERPERFVRVRGADRKPRP